MAKKEGKGLKKGRSLCEGPPNRECQLDLEEVRQGTESKSSSRAVELIGKD